MGNQLYQSDEPISSSEVASKGPSQLHGVLLNSVAATATIQLFDDTTTTSPQNAITGVWTPGAVTVPTFIPLDVETSKGITVIIGVAAANVTLIGRFVN
jgi:hypothetical protein